MSGIHLWLLVLAGLSVLMCFRSETSSQTRAEAVIGLVAMAVAMGSTHRTIVGGAIITMLLLALSPLLRGWPQGLMAWHRWASSLQMMLVIAALAVVNDALLCGPGVLPLIGHYGINDMYLTFSLGLFVRVCVLGLLGYLLFSLWVILRHLDNCSRQKPAAFIEAILMSVVTLGMSVAV